MDLNYPLTKYVYRPISVPLASRLARTRATPDQVTWVSTAVTTAGGVAFAFALYPLGALLALAGGIIDCVDGDLARITGRSSRSGAFLDSVLDRWADAALILGLGLSDFDRYGVAATVALTGAMITSYTRARAQSLGADCPEGIATRDVRILVLVVTAGLGYVMAGLVVVGVLGFVTSLQRTMAAKRSLDELDRRSGESRLSPGPVEPAGE